MAFFYNTSFPSTPLGSTSKSAKTLIQESTGTVHLTLPTTPPKEQAVAGPLTGPSAICICIFPPNWKAQ